MLKSRCLLIGAAFALLGAGVASGMSVTVSASIPSPAPVGTLVTFSASTDATTTNLWYRFRVRRQDSDYQMIRDYGPVSTLNWTAKAHEGAYDIEVSARNLDTGAAAAAFLLFRFQ